MSLEKDNPLLRQMMVDLDNMLPGFPEYLPSKEDAEEERRQHEYIPERCLMVDVEQAIIDGHQAEIEEMLRRTGLEREIRSAIQWDRILQTVRVRNDFPSALRNVKRGADLSHILRYSFSHNDLVTLAKLHRKNRFRKKIEDLLEDCNYHYVCGMLASGEYDALEQRWAQEAQEDARSYFLSVLREYAKAGTQKLVLVNVATGQKQDGVVTWTPDSPERQEQEVDELLAFIAEKGEDAVRYTRLVSFDGLDGMP